MERVSSDQPKVLENILFGKLLIWRFKTGEIKCPETLKAEKINLFFLFQPVNKLRMSDHEEPSTSLMSKNQVQQSSLVMYSPADK